MVGFGGGGARPAVVSVMAAQHHRRRLHHRQGAATTGRCGLIRSYPARPGQLLTMLWAGPDRGGAMFDVGGGG